MDLDSPVKTLLDRRAPTAHPTPLTASVGTSRADLLSMMNEYTLRHIPVVDESGRVVDVVLLDDLVREEELPLRAVIMAGGYGTRLRPITEGLPKPMLPIGDRPLLELTLQQLRDAGIKRVNLATHYKRDIIANHFGDGHSFGVKIRYVEEDQPLGTAGALGLIETSEDPLLVINGDVVTRVDFHAMLDFHRHHRADMTVAVRQHEVQLPHGVVETDGLAITGISEKPILRHFMNAGIYLLNPEMCRFVPSGRRYDMTDLISRLIAEGCRVVSFPIREYWLDIGQVEDYQKALRDFESKTP
jgi:NDP-sugar pyrophosphorylase family protein